MSHGAWTASLQPKVLGSWNLHRLLPRNLDFFILFSSISGIIGAQGQANYAAGNTFQDELARFRLHRGEKAVALDLSILAEEGYVAENKGIFARLSIKQALSMSQSDVFSLLQHYCSNSGSTLVDPTRPSQLVLGLEHLGDVIGRGEEVAGWMQEPMFANLHQVTRGSSSSSANDDTGGVSKEHDYVLISQIQAAESLAEAAETLAHGLAAKLSKILSLPPDSFDHSQPLHTYGVDSLIAVELRNWFQKVLKMDIAVFEILGGATAMTLGRTVAEKLRQQ